MKLSISLSDDIAKEIKHLAKISERHVSWWIQKAWIVARSKLMQSSLEEQNLKKNSMKLLRSLKGQLKTEFPDTDSVTLAKQAFLKK